MKACNPYKHLMMGLIDNELTPEETARVNEHLVRCNDCRQEFDRLCQSSCRLEALSFAEPGENELDRIWKRPFSRVSKASGLVLVFGGWVAMVIYSIFEVMRSDGEPALPKIAAAAICIGFLILFASVLRDRLHAAKSDPYKEVKR